jgi:hypothetical protein
MQISMLKCSIYLCWVSKGATFQTSNVSPFLGCFLVTFWFHNGVPFLHLFQNDVQIHLGTANELSVTLCHDAVYSICTYFFFLRSMFRNSIAVLSEYQPSHTTWLNQYYARTSSGHCIVEVDEYVDPVPVASASIPQVSLGTFLFTLCVMLPTIEIVHCHPASSWHWIHFGYSFEFYLCCMYFRVLDPWATQDISGKCTLYWEVQE